MDDTLNCWCSLAEKVLIQAIKEAQAGETIRQRLDARHFLFDPDAEWLLKSLDVDVGRIRDALLTVWTHQAY